MTRYVMIAIGGALGAIARYQIAVLVQSRLPGPFPWGTLVVNVTGCFVMGIAATLLTERLAVSPQWGFAIPIGFIGAYTTFSAFEMDLFRAISQQALAVAGAYLVASVAAGYAALVAGVAIARAL